MRAITLGAALAGALAVSVSAQADDSLKRKPGLWELRMQNEGQPSPMGPMQMCVDETNADPTQQPPGAPKQDCDKPSVSKDGDKIVVHTSCKMGSSKVLSEIVTTGDMSSAYHTDIHSTFDPPIQGKKDTTMTMDVKWLGACAPGQKAGMVGAKAKGKANAAPQH